jgi:uncharacterized membrane protein HdeD (DUF308 family)
MKRAHMAWQTLVALWAALFLFDGISTIMRGWYMRRAFGLSKGLLRLVQSVKLILGLVLVFANVLMILGRAKRPVY